MLSQTGRKCEIWCNNLNSNSNSTSEATSSSGIAYQSLVTDTSNSDQANVYHFVPSSAEIPSAECALRMSVTNSNNTNDSISEKLGKLDLSDKSKHKHHDDTSNDASVLSPSICDILPAMSESIDSASTTASAGAKSTDLLTSSSKKFQPVISPTVARRNRVTAEQLIESVKGGVTPPPLVAPKAKVAQNAVKPVMAPQRKSISTNASCDFRKCNSLDQRGSPRSALHHKSFRYHVDDESDDGCSKEAPAGKIPVSQSLKLNDEGVYRQLGQYKVGNRTLGHGSYSIVRLAYNEQDQSHYAMKVLSKKKLTKKHRMSRKQGDPLSDVKREIAILRKVRHPNIINLVEVLDDPSEDFLYLVFELLSQEVVEVPTDHPISEEAAWRYFREVVCGVEYLHHHRIVHRDLKPSNMLLTKDGSLKIADFGVSDEFEGVDAWLSGTVGTPAFTAPECLNPTIKSYSGKAIDIWCMGISLYTFVYGDVPFRDDFLLGLYNKIRFSDVVFPLTPKISDEIKDLIVKMLAKAPEDRIPLQEIKKHEWVTKLNFYPMPSEEENCRADLEITEQEVENSVREVPKLSTLILVRCMLKRASFLHPFRSQSTCT